MFAEKYVPLTGYEKLAWEDSKNEAQYCPFFPKPRPSLRRVFGAIAAVLVILSIAVVALLNKRVSSSMNKLKDPQALWPDSQSQHSIAALRQS
jgi:hypothetical protein